MLSDSGRGTRVDGICGCVRLYVSTTRPPERSPTAHWVKWANTHHRLWYLPIYALEYGIDVFTIRGRCAPGRR
jgi:hypothetical protein